MIEWWMAVSLLPLLVVVYLVLAAWRRKEPCSDESYSQSAHSRWFESDGRGGPMRHYYEIFPDRKPK